MEDRVGQAHVLLDPLEAEAAEVPLSIQELHSRSIVLIEVDPQAVCSISVLKEHSGGAVVIATEDKAYTHEVSNADTFRQYQIGSRWVLHTNKLGGITSIDFPTFDGGSYAGLQ